MIVTKDLRVDVLGEPIFEKVNLVIRPGERVGILGKGSEVTTFLQVLAGEEEMDSGTVAAAGERLIYVSPDTLRGGTDALIPVLHGRPSFLLLDATTVGHTTDIQKFIEGYRGGILLASEDAQLMHAAKVTRILEIQPTTKSITSYTGTFAEYTVEREKNRARLAEAYEKQQKEKRRIESWLEEKRKDAAGNRSPEKGSTIRTKVKYLQREILDKEIPKPVDIIEE